MGPLAAQEWQLWEGLSALHARVLGPSLWLLPRGLSNLCGQNGKVRQPGEETHEARERSEREWQEARVGLHAGQGLLWYQ